MPNRQIAGSLLGLLLLLSSCEPATTSSDAADDATLRLLYWQAPTILNPHLSNGFKDAEASRITLEPLASFNAAGELIPFLAAEIPSVDNGGVAADGRSVTWKLKPDVVWSDGTPLTAQDVVFTYEFISNPEVGAVTAGTYEMIETVEALDEHTVKVTFKAPNPAWSIVFTGTEGMILPAHAFADVPLARDAEANLQPIGTGPYRVVEFSPGDVVVYEPNPNYREADTLAFDRVELKGGGDSASAARAVLQTGDADFAYNVQVEAPVLAQLESGGQGQVVASFGALVERILINFTDPDQATASGERSSVEFPHPFLTDPQVRQAFDLAIDRDAIAQQLYGPAGQGTANFLVAPEAFRSANVDYEYSLDKAAALLDEAGWRDTDGDGIRDQAGTDLSVLFITSVNPLRQKTQEIVKQSLQQLGVAVELKSLDPSIYFSGDPSSTDTVERFYADLQMFTTGNTNPDPGSYMKTYTCDEIPQEENNWAKQNYSRYCNPAYDQLWQRSTTELDPAARQALFIEMNDLLVEEAAVLPIVHRADVDAVSNQLVGVELTPWDLHTWNIAEWRRP
ncbi:MAG: peptide ABC transporter substrate-binding protein [Leptolyngbya sp. SIO4C1]|nr:peptide ABC transporter substrate-binding protein [Leptolyngbya sp. SIO4C1]